MSNPADISLQDFSLASAQDALSELEESMNLVSEGLVNAVEMYQGSRGNTKMKDAATSMLAFVLNQFDNSGGWKVFQKFFEFPKHDGEPLTLSYVLPAIESIQIGLPWSRAAGCWLFTEDIEDKLLIDGEYKFPHEKLIGEVGTLNAESSEIIRRMGLGLGRKRAVLELLFNLEVLDAIEVFPRLRMVDRSGNFSEAQLMPDIGEKDVKTYVREIFKKHYELERENLIKQNFFPSQVESNDECWSILLNSAEKFKNELTIIKNKYLNIILNYKEEEKYQVFNDIRDFLRRNNLKEETPPTITELQSTKFKEYGLVKKISKVGMSKVRKEYTPWIISLQQGEEEIRRNLVKRFTPNQYANYKMIDIKWVERAMKENSIKVSKEEPYFTEQDITNIEEWLMKTYKPRIEEHSLENRND